VVATGIPLMVKDADPVMMVSGPPHAQLHWSPTSATGTPLIVQEALPEIIGPPTCGLFPQYAGHT